MKCIMILSDDAGYGDLGCYGGAIKTPNLDQLAKDGVRFTRFYVASPVCSTSRIAFTTGRLPQYAHAHYVDDPANSYRAWLPAGTATDGSILQSLGHKTGHFGKWHMGSPPQTTLPRRHGYERFFGGLAGQANSAWGAPYVRYSDCYWLDDEPPAIIYKGDADDVVTAKLIDWLPKVASGDFFAHLWFFAPHEPCVPLEPERSTYYSDLPDRQQRYYSMMTRADSLVGELRAALASLRIEDDTHIFYASDNGPEPQDPAFRGSAGSTGGLRGCKTHLWEGGLRVPAIWKGPGVAPGRVDSSVRWALDFLPTVVKLAGGVPRGLPGSSLLEPVEDRILTWEYNSRGVKGRVRPTPAPGGFRVVLRTEDDFKLHRFAQDGSRDALYDLKSDPGETVDVSASFPQVKAELVAAMNEFNPPAEGLGHDIPLTNPPKNEQATIAALEGPELPQFNRYARTGSDAEIGAFCKTIDKLLGLETDTTQTGYIAMKTAHPTLGEQTILFGPDLAHASQVPSNRARCSADELAEIDERLVFATGIPRR